MNINHLNKSIKNVSVGYFRDRPVRAIRKMESSQDNISLYWHTYYSHEEETHEIETGEVYNHFKNTELYTKESKKTFIDHTGHIPQIRKKGILCSTKGRLIGKHDG